MAWVTLGQRIRIGMVVTDLSAKELAEQAGVNISTVYRVLHRPETARPETIDLIVNALDHRLPGIRGLILDNETG